MAEKRDQEYEALLDNYEDAIMRIVMYRVAQEDGKRLLEEAEELERSGFEVPASLDEKCRKLIREAPVQQAKEPAPEQEQARRSRPQRVPVLRTALRMLIAAILAAALLFTVAYASSDEFRVKVLNFFLEVEEKGTYFFFRSEDTPANRARRNPETQDFPFSFTYIPDGYEPVIHEVRDYGATEAGYFYGYLNPQYDYHEFYFQIEPIAENMGLFVDTEDAVVTEVKIRGYDGWLIERENLYTGENKISYFWLDLERRYMFFYASLGITPNESRKIFDGIIINEQIL